MQTFVVVVEHLSFSAASRQLDIVTSAVSRQVSDLEEHFNCQLLYRTTRAMHLTSEGQYYLEQFQDILMRVNDLELNAHERQNTLAGHLRITSPFSAERLGIQVKISEFLKENPEVKLSWLSMNRYVDLVEEGVDLAVRVGELADSSFIARPFTKQSILFVASPSYLLEKGTPQHPQELKQHQCILDSSSRQPGRWRYHDAGKERQVTVNSSIEVNQGDLVAQFSATGHGVAVLPEFLVQTYLDKGELISILQEFQYPAIPVSLVYPANRLINPALKALVNYLLEQ